MPTTRVGERQIGAFSKLELIESTSPSSPASGNEYLYFKSDGKLYKKNSAGTESEVAVKTVTFGVDGSGALPRLLWLKNNKPSVYEKTKTLTMIDSWVLYRLSGEFGCDPSNGGTTGAYIS